MKKILSVFGTRPEAIKMSPVLKALESFPGSLESLVCVTGQHRQMLDQVIDLFCLRVDHDLDVMRTGQDLYDLTGRVLCGLRTVLQKEQPDLVLVHGDTTTTMAASLAAFYAKIPVAHIEAGLRTHDKYAPFPEEINRRVTGVVADLHLAPTATARENLLCEGIDSASIHVTGNTVIDALLMAASRVRERGERGRVESELLSRFPELAAVLENDDRRIVLVTGHRRENFGKGFEGICHALADVAQRYPDVAIVYPVHLNPNVQEPVRRILGGQGQVNVFLIEPLDYLPFVYLMDRSFLLLTDSGGVQEEAPSLAKPVLVMRETTERPEAVDAGTVKLVGTDPQRIIAEVEHLLKDQSAYSAMSRAQNPYGDGKSAERIVRIIRSFLNV